jgi:hypothetical protein
MASDPIPRGQIPVYCNYCGAYQRRCEYDDDKGVTRCGNTHREVYCRNCGHELTMGRCQHCTEHDAETIGAAEREG